jgi:hypothetical protein
MRELPVSDNEVNQLVETFWERFPPYIWPHLDEGQRDIRVRAFARSVYGLIGVELARNFDSAVAAASRTEAWDPDDLLPRFIAPAAEATGDQGLMDRVMRAFDGSFSSHMGADGVSLFEARPNLDPRAVRAGAEAALSEIGASPRLIAIGAPAQQTGYEIATAEHGASSTLASNSAGMRPT